MLAVYRIFHFASKKKLPSQKMQRMRQQKPRATRNFFAINQLRRYNNE